MVVRMARPLGTARVPCCGGVRWWVEIGVRVGGVRVGRSLLERLRRLGLV